MQRADRIGPALLDDPGKRRATFRLHQRVLIPGLGRVDIERRRHHVVVAGEHDRCAHREASHVNRDDALGALGARGVGDAVEAHLRQIAREMPRVAEQLRAAARERTPQLAD